MNADGDMEKWEFGGGSWEAGSFEQVGAGKLTELWNKKIGSGEISNVLIDKNNNIVLPTEITQENGIYITSTGAYNYNASYAITHYIPIKGLKQIKWNGYIPIDKVDIAALTFYDYKKQRISSITVGPTGTYTEEKREINSYIPEDAYYCQGCTCKNDSFSIEIDDCNIEYILKQNILMSNELLTLNRGSLKSSDELNPIISGVYKFEIYLTKEELEYNLSILTIGWANDRFYVQIGKDGILYKDLIWNFKEAPTGIQNLVYYSDILIVNSLIDTSAFASLKLVNVQLNPFCIDSIPYYLNPNINEEIKSYIALPTIISYEYSPSSAASVFFNIPFSIGDEITVIAETDSSISKTILSNISFDDGGVDNPTIDIVNGNGSVVLKYDKSGTLKDFGFKSKPEETFTVQYTITIKSKYSLYNNLPSISNNDNRVCSLSDNPLRIIKETPGFAAILHSIGYAGDSLMSGEMAYSVLDSNVYKDCYEFSWGQRLSAMIGGIATNFSKGGLTTQSWISTYINSQENGNSNDNVDRKFTTSKYQAYINGLGTNDTNRLLTIGTIDDIDFDNYNNNADTFYGNYARILQKARDVSPKSYLFCLTIPTIWQSTAEARGYNDAIRNIAKKFEKCYIIDLYKYLPVNDYISNYISNGHMNTQGYQWIAYAIGTYIDYIITQNPLDFARAALFGTEKENDMW
nr:MAG TPA: GDSL like Lipase Acylhydrolase [Caudoviricetes sp.]